MVVLVFFFILEICRIKFKDFCRGFEGELLEGGFGIIGDIFYFSVFFLFGEFGFFYSKVNIVVGFFIWLFRVLRDLSGRYEVFYSLILEVLEFLVKVGFKVSLDLREEN